MINETPGQTFVKAEQILPESYLTQLSRNGRNLYSTLWNRLKNRNITTVWQYDEEIARRSMMRLEQLPAAQSELQRAGLIHLMPGAVQSQYELLPIETEDNGYEH